MFNTAKVHPEVERKPEIDDVELVSVKFASEGFSLSVGGGPGGSKFAEGTKSGGVDRGSSSAGRRRILEWDEIVEDLDLAIENTKTKCREYHYEGKPLKREMPKSKMGLRDITEGHMNSYGFESLWTVSEIFLAEEEMDVPLSLPEILDQMKCLKVAGGKDKMIIWIEDMPRQDKRELFSHLLITELMLENIEPEIVLPCHDFEQHVLLGLVKKAEKRLSPEERQSYGENQADFEKAVISQLLRVGLTVSLASSTAKLIIIDANSSIWDEPEVVSLINKADEIGHTVLFYRNTLTINKTEKVQTFKKLVKAWHQVTSERDATNPTDFMNIELMEDDYEVDIKWKKAKKDAAASKAKALIEKELGPHYIASVAKASVSSSKMKK